MARRKKPARKSSLTTCRRRWARRGRSLADFLMSFLLTAVGHLVGAGRAVMVQLVSAVLGVLRRRDRRPPEERGGGVGAESCQSQTSARRFQPLQEKPEVRFDDIVGLEDAKREIRLRMILPLKHPELAREYGIRQGGGLLLYGPPGTGKTMLAKAVATEIDATFYSVRSCDIMSGQVGRAETNVATLFDQLRKETRSVLFIDEIDSLVPNRKRNGSTIAQRVVSQLLGEVDGLSSSSGENTMLLVGATNLPDMVDPAMLRPGRFDAKVHVPVPSREARVELITKQLAGRPLAENIDVSLLAERTDAFSGADIRHLAEEAADKAFLRRVGSHEVPSLISMGDLLDCRRPVQLRGSKPQLAAPT